MSTFTVEATLVHPEHRERVWGLIETERVDRGTTVLFSTHYLAEAEGCDRVVLLANGRAVGADTPRALKAAIGDDIVEIEGPEAAGLLPDLAHLLDVVVTIKTERGYRVGVEGPRDRLSRVASLVPPSLRVTIGPVTLDDVYFARTQKTTSAAATVLVEGRT